MRPIEKLLSRLERVKRAGPSKWTARCPTRADKSPSLAIRELDDGTVLLHDFGGAGVDEIVAAVGLDLSDLFPASPTKHSFTRRSWSANDLLNLVAFEAGICAVIVADIVAGKTPSAKDRKRLLVAAARLGDAAEICK